VKGSKFVVDALTEQNCLLGAFKRRAHQYIPDLPDKEDELEWLALMQHYGAPTRLLDCTTSPYVATFFAATSVQSPEDSAVWAFYLPTLSALVTAVRDRCGVPATLRGRPWWVSTSPRYCLSFRISSLSAPRRGQSACGRLANSHSILASSALTALMASSSAKGIPGCAASFVDSALTPASCAASIATRGLRRSSAM
jgi:FRG domain